MSTDRPQRERQGQPDEAQATARAAAARRRRRAAVFGDVLPEATSDDRDEGDRGTGGNDEWLRRQVPPHHG